MLTKAVDLYGHDHYAYTDDPGLGDRRFCPYCGKPVLLAHSRTGTPFFRVCNGEHEKPYCRMLSHTQAKGRLPKKAVEKLIDRCLSPEPEQPAELAATKPTASVRADGATTGNGVPKADGTAAANGVPMADGTAAVNGVPTADGTAAVNGVPTADGTAVANGVSMTDGTAAVNVTATCKADDGDDADDVRIIRKPMDIFLTGFLHDLAAGNPTVGPIDTLRAAVVYYPWAAEIADRIRQTGGKYIVACRLTSVGTTRTGNRYYQLRVFWRAGKTAHGEYIYDDLVIRAYCNSQHLADVIDKRLPPIGKDGKYVRHTCLLVAKLQAKNNKLHCIIINRNQLSINLEED